MIQNTTRSPPLNGSTKSKIKVLELSKENLELNQIDMAVHNLKEAFHVQELSNVTELKKSGPKFLHCTMNGSLPPISNT